MFKRSLTALAAALTLGLAAASAQAAAVSLLNFDADAASAVPGFPGPPSSGSTTGLVLVEDDGANNLSTVAPWVFRSQLLLETTLGADGGSGRFQSFSGWSYTFGAVAGTTYAYTYNFFTSLGLRDTDTADFFVFVDDASFTTVDFVKHASDDGSLVAGGPLAYRTGVQRREFTALTSGQYTFTAVVGTSQAGCLTGDPVACIPSFAIVNGVPEPGTFALAGLALFGLVAPRLRRQTLH